MSMDVNQAVQKAKDYISEIYAGEGISRIGLEEIRHVDDYDWEVTIGFVRTFNDQPLAQLAVALGNDPRRRVYKVVRLNEDGIVQSMTHRAVATSDNP